MPDELQAFLELEGPQTLLVRGGPGTGKTSLTFEMLRAFPGKRLYVTCRVPEAKIRRDFHWLVQPEVEEWKMLDLTVRPSSLEEAARILSSASTLLAAEGRDEALKALWLPGAVQEAWGEADPASPALIVVDPWNAFIEQYASSGRTGPGPVPSVREIEHTLLRLIGRTNIRLVFVMEGSEETSLDYLVDGVVITSRIQAAEHTERWLNLSKLRGVAIRRPLYPFTLDDGRFRCFTPMPSPDGMHPVRAEPDRSPRAESMWPGNQDFAKEFGRLPTGSLSLIEMGAEVPREVARVLLLPMLSQVLTAGGRAVLIPPPTLNPDDSYSELARLVPRETLEKNFRVLGVFPSASLTGPSTGPIFVPPSRISWTKDGVTVPVPEDPVFRVGRAEPGGSNLMVVYFSGLEGLAQSAGALLTREAIAGAAQLTFGGAPVQMVGVGRAGDPYFAAVSPVAALHLRVESRQGRVMVHGARPFTEEFALTQAGPDSPYRLVRID